MLGQFIRYAIVGAVNTGLDFGMYTGLTRGFEFWREHYLFSKVIAAPLVVGWNFSAYRFWAFSP